MVNDGGLFSKLHKRGIVKPRSKKINRRESKGQVSAFISKYILILIDSKTLEHFAPNDDKLQLAMNHFVGG